MEASDAEARSKLTDKNAFEDPSGACESSTTRLSAAHLFAAEARHLLMNMLPPCARYPALNAEMLVNTLESSIVNPDSRFVNLDFVEGFLREGPLNERVPFSVLVGLGAHAAMAKGIKRRGFKKCRSLAVHYLAYPDEAVEEATYDLIFDLLMEAKPSTTSEGQYESQVENKLRHAGGIRRKLEIIAIFQDFIDVFPTTDNARALRLRVLERTNQIIEVVAEKMARDLIKVTNDSAAMLSHGSLSPSFPTFWRIQSTANKIHEALRDSLLLAIGRYLPFSTQYCGNGEQMWKEKGLQVGARLVDRAFENSLDVWRSLYCLLLIGSRLKPERVPGSVISECARRTWAVLGVVTDPRTSTPERAVWTVGTVVDSLVFIWQNWPDPEAQEVFAKAVTPAFMRALRGGSADIPTEDKFAVGLFLSHIRNIKAQGDIKPSGSFTGGAENEAEYKSEQEVANESPDQKFAADQLQKAVLSKESSLTTTHLRLIETQEAFKRLVTQSRFSIVGSTVKEQKDLQRLSTALEKRKGYSRSETAIIRRGMGNKMKEKMGDAKERLHRDQSIELDALEVGQTQDKKSDRLRRVMSRGKIHLTDQTTKKEPTPVHSDDQDEEVDDGFEVGSYESEALHEAQVAVSSSKGPSYQNFRGPHERGVVLSETVEQTSENMAVQDLVRALEGCANEEVEVMRAELEFDLGAERDCFVDDLKVRDVEVLQGESTANLELTVMPGDESPQSNLSEGEEADHQSLPKEADYQRVPMLNEVHGNRSAPRQEKAVDKQSTTAEVAEPPRSQTSLNAVDSVSLTKSTRENLDEDVSSTSSAQPIVELTIVGSPQSAVEDGRTSLIERVETNMNFQDKEPEHDLADMVLVSPHQSQSGLNPATSHDLEGRSS